MSPRSTSRYVERPQKSFAAGMNDTVETDEYLSNEVGIMYNARVVSGGDASRRRGGSQRMHASALNSGAAVQAVVEYYDAAGAQYQLIIAGNKSYVSTDDGASWTEKGTGLNIGAWDFTIMQSGAARLLIMVSGSGAPLTFDGTTWGTLTGVSIPEDATHCEYHNNRLWVWGHNDPLMVGSAVDDPTDFSSGSGGVTVRIDGITGDPRPRGLWSFGSALIAFTLDQVGFVEGWGLNTIQVNTGHRGLSRSVGCVSHRTIAPVGDTGIMWLSRLGWVYMPLGGGPELVSGKVQQFVDGLSWDNMVDNPEIPSAAWSAEFREYHCAVPAYGSNQNTNTIVFRLPSPGGNPMARYIFRAEDVVGEGLEVLDGVLELKTGGQEAAIIGGVLELLTPGSPGTPVAVVDGVLELVVNNSIAATLYTADHAAEVKAKALWSGGSDGFARRMEFGNTDDALLGGTGGEVINAWIRSRPEDWEDQFRRKEFRSIRTSIKAPGGGTIDIYPVVDGIAGNAMTKTLVPQNTIQVVTAKVEGKGHELQVDLRFTDDLTILGTAPSAEPLRESP